ncbi:hypothetical protein HQ560_19225 [bacterium]|nr:hypothetical protein [bacterium]
MDRAQILRRRITVLVGFFIIALVLSGVTAFPLEWELDTLARWAGAADDAVPADHTGMTMWLLTVRNGLRETYAKYPWYAYGTDWLAFAHIILGIMFIGPLRDPVRNIWVIDVGLIACAGVIVLAMVCGPIRGIPFYWRLIDCSFGVFGAVPLWMVRRWTVELGSAACDRT